MKKLLTICFLAVTAFIVFSFKSNSEKSVNTRYVFITAIEWDTNYDEPGNNGYVDITTNIVSYDCNKSDNSIKYQFIDFYNGEVASSTKSLAFNNTTTMAWSYSSYDEALASRRDWLANKTNQKYKRRIERFYITCN